MHAPVLDDRGWRHLVLAGIVIGLLCALLIGFWMARPASAPAAAPGAATGATAGKPAEGTETQSVPGAALNPTQEAPSTSAPGPTAPAHATPDSGASSTVSSPGAAAAGAAGSPAAVPGAPALRSPKGEEGSAPGAEAGRLPVATVPPSTGMAYGLLVRFVDRSWVEVSKPDGRVLLSHIGEAGSVELVNASAPLVLVIGRADAVKVEYRGQAVNLKPYANAANGVARVMLAESDTSSGGKINR